MILRREVPPAMALTEVRAGRWERIRPGAYLPVVEALEPYVDLHRRALARIVAVDAGLDTEHALSHESAALLWGLPLIGDGSTVHLTQVIAQHRGSADVRRHRHRLSDGDVVELDGRRVTSLARTVADCASSLPAQDGLALADSALRRGLDRAECLDLLRGRVGHRGVRRAMAVLGLADDGAESPGESRLRHVVLRAGLPVPQTQVLVETREGSAWGDLGWPEWRLIAEYDGVAKYTVRSTAAAAVLKERRREVAVEREGWRVVRVTSADLRRPEALVAELIRRAPPGTRERLRPRVWLASPSERQQAAGPERAGEASQQR